MVSSQYSSGIFLLTVLGSFILRIECSCYRHEFKCTTGDMYFCLSPKYVCDGIKDCSDGSDEVRCPDQSCDFGEFPCMTSSGFVCQPNHYKCDGEGDCMDNSDELNCPGKQTKRNGLNLLDYMKTRKQRHDNPS